VRELKGFAFTTEAVFALIVSLSLIGFALTFDYGNPCLRIHEYSLAQDAAQIAVKHYGQELASFWRCGAEPAFIRELTREAGALNASIRISNREWGAECKATAVTVKRAAYDSGELTWVSFTFCYP